MEEFYLKLWYATYQLIQQDFFVKLTSLILLISGLWFMFRRKLFYVGMGMIFLSVLLAISKILVALFTGNFPNAS